jgi:hypothetical protein
VYYTVVIGLISAVAYKNHITYTAPLWVEQYTQVNAKTFKNSSEI